MDKIGIGITTQNRRQVALDSLVEIKKYSPNAKIVIVDDCSHDPFPNADFRFTDIAGVAKAKNKCLELLEDCDYIFLFDDDCYPISEGWEQYYITAYEKKDCHQMQFIFDKLKSGFKTGNDAVTDFGLLLGYSNPCGTMIFLTNKCLKTIGGFDTDFGRYGYEHIEYSRRAFNAGLTVHPFMDIKESGKLFFSLDQQQEIRCTFNNTIEKRKLYEKNKQLYLDKYNDKHFKPFK